MAITRSDALAVGDAVDVARWKRLAIVALALVALSTVLLASLIDARGPTAPARSAPSSLPQAAPSASAPAARAASSGSGDSAAPARPRVYSPVDVSTLAAARAHGQVSAAPGDRVDNEVAEAAPARDVIGAESVAPVKRLAVAPVSITPSLAARTSSSQPAPRVPVIRQADAPTTSTPPAERHAQRRVDGREAIAAVPVVVEPTPSRVAFDDGARQRRPDAAQTDLDAAWDRREQWMRDRLRQR